MGHLKTAPPHPSQCAHWDSLPLLAPFGRHFPLTGGISLPPGEGILTPNPPAQNRRPVVRKTCLCAHVSVPDVTITVGDRTPRGPASHDHCARWLRHWELDARFLCCQKIHIQFSNAEPGGSAYLPRGAFRNYAAARPGGRVLQSISQRVGGHMGPSLRLKRTTLITGSAPLIRLAFGHPPSPFGLQLFPPDRGNRTSPKGKALRAGLGPAPTADMGVATLFS